MSEDLVRSLAKSEKRLAQLEMATAEHRHYRDPQWDEWCRRCNRYGRANYTDHFRSGTIPTGYAWVSDGTFNGAPGGAGGTLNYSYNGTYMNIVCDNTPHFLATAITVYTSKHFMGRFCTARDTQCGIRVDDGTNNNYAIHYLQGNTNGSYTLKFSYRAGGGVTTNSGPSAIDTEFTSILMYHYVTDPSFVGYTVNEAMGWSYWDGATTGVIAWTPSRIGLFYGFNAGYPCFTDLFFSNYE
jgi:hypothetical protein